jgi:hypothetical protein
MPQSRHHFRLAPVLGIALLAAGCGGPRLVEVTGTATRLSKPVPDLVIHFVPENGLRSVGVTDREGNFKMLSLTGQPGVRIGAHKVWVELRPAGAKDDAEQQERLARQQSDPELVEVLRKYGNVATTPIVVEVKNKGVVNIQLDP